MYFLSSASLCQLILITKIVNSYVLFAANLEDLRAVAKKFIPEYFADRLTQAVSDVSLKEVLHLNNDPKSQHSSEETTSNESEKVYFKGRESSTGNNARMSFEDLVKKVKQRLEKEFRNKFKKHLSNTKSEQRITVINNDKENNTKQINTQNIRKKTSTFITTTENIYIEEHTVTEPIIHQLSDELSAGHKSFEKQPKQSTKQHFMELPVKELINKEPLVNQKDKRELGWKPKKKQHFKKNDDVKTFSVPIIPKRIKNVEPFNTIHTQKGFKMRPKEPNKENNKPVKKQKSEMSVDHNAKDQNIIFEETFLGQKKDSYEDYVAPGRDANVFVSHEKQDVNRETRFKIANNKHSSNNSHQRPKEKLIKLKIANDKQQTSAEDIFEGETEPTIASDEIKARTLNLWEINDNARKDTEILKEDKEKIKRVVTHKPKRDFYLVHTPAYVTNATLVVEKYDFNEPIPEKDRVRINLTFFGDPVSKVNKKVRLFK